MNTEKLSLISLITGIISMVLCYYKLGGILGIIAITLGIITLVKGDKQWMAIVGLVCGIIGFICSAVVAIVKVSEAVKESKQETVAESVTPTPEPTPTPTPTPTPSPAPEPKPQIEPNEPLKDEEDNNSIWATEYTPISDFRYTVDESKHEITLVRYEGDDKKIMLSPVYILDGEEYELVSMGDDACFLSETDISSVYIPDGVVSIGDSCFNSCARLEHVRLPKTIKKFGSAFFTYFDDYEVVFNAEIETPDGYDVNNYDLSPDDSNQAYALGEDLARALNGIVGGVDESMDDSHRSETIYFGGTEKEWNAIGGKLDDEPEPPNNDTSDEMYQKGKQAGDKLAEDLGNIDW